MSTENEQKLVDLCFEIGLTINMYSDTFKDETREGLAEWIAKQLRDNGFDTSPCGSSWGVLKI